MVGPAAAQPAEEDVNGRVEEAKALFDQGNRLRSAGDCERALVFFVRSRALVPSIPNTLNAGYCAHQLGRFDEALGFYEALLVQFATELGDAQRGKVERRVEELLRRVGRLTIHANTDAAIVVDGRPRGRTSTGEPLALLPGKHRVRLVQTGFEQAETVVEVTAGRSRQLTLTLQPLQRRGVVRVTAEPGATVLLDGANVGTVPWEATLAPGTHMIALELADRGTGPRMLTVVEGQVSVLETPLLPLGPEVRLRVEPSTASVSLDGATLPGSAWSGRLPIGKHRLAASAEGYVSVDQEVEVTADGPREVALELRVDEAHPRWAKPREAELRLGLWGGPALGSGLGSGAESCTGFRCDDSSGAGGLLGALRFDYELPSQLLLTASAGFISVGVDGERSVDVPLATRTATYRIEDDIGLAGPFVEAGLGYRLSLGEVVDLTGRGQVGVIFASTKQTSTATVSDGEDTITADVDGTGSATDSASVFLHPTMELGLNLAALRVSLGVGVLWVPISGADNDHGDTSPRPRAGTNCTSTPLPVDCAINTGITRNETSHGSFALVVPTLGLAWAF